MKGNQESYGLLAMLLHWSSVVIIFAVLIIGYLMANFIQNETLKLSLYLFHLSLGITIAIITMLRIIWMVFDVRPQLPKKLGKGRKYLFQSNHIMIYLLLLTMIVSGAIILTSSDLIDVITGVEEKNLDNILENTLILDLHRISSYGLVLFIFIHITGVLLYHIKDEPILWRMGIGKI